MAFLRAHPGFLAENPGLYEGLEPPRRVFGAALADHMAAMLHQARARAAAAEQAGADAAADRRAAEGFGQRVQEAVLALMRAPEPAWFATHELPALLRLDSARLCCEAPPPPGAARIPRGTVTAAMGQRGALVRAAQPDAPLPNRLLHGEAVALAAAEALVRIPLAAGPALLALACRDGKGLAGATTGALMFLGQAIATALEHVQPGSAP